MDTELFRLIPLKRQNITWQSLEERVHHSKDIDESTKALWRESVQFLRQEFGNGFFDTCTKEHPLFLKLVQIPWLIDDVFFFVKTLQQLKASESNYPLLHSKLIKAKKCKEEGLVLAEVAGWFLENDFSVYFIKEEHYKTPDLKITDKHSGEQVFIEVSKIRDTVERERINYEFSTVANTLLLFGYDTPYAYKQLKHLSDEELAEITEKVKKMKDDAAQEQKLVTYVDDRIILGIAHPSSIDSLRQWQSENNVSPGASGLSVDFNDTPRIRRQQKIYNKIKQIPKGETGLLIFPFQFLNFMCMDPADTTWTLLQEIRNYPNLLGVVFYANLGQPIKEETIRAMEHVFSIKMVNGIARHLLYIHNDQYSGTINASTIQKVLDSFV